MVQNLLRYITDFYWVTQKAKHSDHVSHRQGLIIPLGATPN